MKNKFVLCIVGVLMSLNVMGASQVKKPTLMILPSDYWCQTRFFMTTWDNQGVKVKTADMLRILRVFPQKNQRQKHLQRRLLLLKKFRETGAGRFITQAAKTELTKR